MNITDRYLTLVDHEKWSEALPLIKEIVERAPHIATSWFNYGVCLSALNRNAEAAEKFIKAYELEPENFGAQFRVFHSLHLAQDKQRFLQFARQECRKSPEVL